MKKILVLASSAALVLSGCNRVDRLKDGPSPDESRVSFSTYLGTKGLEKTDFKMGDQFFTYGVKTDADFNVKTPAFTEYVFTGSAPLNHGLTVTHMGLDGVNPIWEYNEVAPWDNKKATFFAVSPVPQGTVTHGVTLNAIANNAIPKVNFEVVGGYTAGAAKADILAASEKIKEQADLMWAYSPDNIKTGGVIQMQFRHALSQLSFSVKAYHTTGLLRVNSVTLKKVMTKGTLALAHDQANKGAVNYLGGWNAASAPLDFAVNLLTEKVGAIDPFVATPGDTEPAKINITDNDEALMMIPQVLTGIGLEVRYSYSLDGKEWINYESGTALDYELAKLSSHWNPNKRYNYCLNINPGKAITFNAAIDEWDPLNSQLDMEYRTFDAKATPHELTVADGTHAKFDIKQGDKVSVAYIYNPVVPDGEEWLNYTTGASGAVATQLKAATAVTASAANAGNWKLSVVKNLYPNVRKAVVTVDRAPFKKMVNGQEISFSAGVAKYVVTQVAGPALAPTSVMYGVGPNGAILTGLNGYTTTSYPNALGTTAYTTGNDAFAGEYPYIRFRVAKQIPTSSTSLTSAISACAAYSEEGMPAGKWRMPRMAELFLIYRNQAAIDLQLTDKLNTHNYWSTTLTATANNYYIVSMSNGGAFQSLISSSYFVRCVAEE